MAKSTTTPSRVRSREAMEHQSRLTLSSAKDHACEREVTSKPVSRCADRFIPFRATSDQSGLDDSRSPNQCTSREVSMLRAADFPGMLRFLTASCIKLRGLAAGQYPWGFSFSHFAGMSARPQNTSKGCTIPSDILDSVANVSNRAHL